MASHPGGDEPSCLGKGGKRQTTDTVNCHWLQLQKPSMGEEKSVESPLDATSVTDVTASVSWYVATSLAVFTVDAIAVYIAAVASGHAPAGKITWSRKLRPLAAITSRPNAEPSLTFFVADMYGELLNVAFSGLEKTVSGISTQAELHPF